MVGGSEVWLDRLFGTGKALEAELNCGCEELGFEFFWRSKPWGLGFRIDLGFCGAVNW